MLELTNIHKIYPAGGDDVHALKGISLQFRESEFVAILGPSGCGKTTMLNIIGGLDQYTEGDLSINGKSTKDFKDRDWDAYRNHSIGFVFQSYNLIPHQTVLQNVELALTLSGVSKKERRARAAEALRSVGLESQMKKKPTEMSGGQMQRVAIARAIVNNPDIIMADEPTGALDSETSIQVMDILKSIAKDRLVIMVTHNPDLADKYATRTIRMLDGVIQSDSMPLTAEELAAFQAADALKETGKKVKKPSMKFSTSFGLSLKNLFTKRGRTILTSFAGSIGIIGIALIYAVSQGTNDYIDNVQQDTLSTYPLTITSESADMTSMLTGLMAAAGESADAEPGTIGESRYMAQMLAQIGTNDLESFKTYLEEHMAEIENDINAVSYNYGVSANIYTRDCEDELIQVNPSTLMSSMMPSYMSSYMSSMGIFSEMIDDQELLDSQYDVLAGHWPKKYDEMILVLYDETSMPDMISYNIGLRDQDELQKMIDDVMDGIEVTIDSKPLSWTYEELMNLDFRLVHASDCYQYNADHKVWEDMTKDEDFMEDLFEDAEKLHVVGIVCPKKGVAASALTTGFAYLPELTDYVIAEAGKREIVKEQLKNEDVDVFTGKEFGAEDDESGLDFGSMIDVDQDAIADAFGSIDEDSITKQMTNSMSALGNYISADTRAAQEDFEDGLTKLSKGMFNYFFNKNKTAKTVAYPATPTSLPLNINMASLSSSKAGTLASEYLATSTAKTIINALNVKYGFSADTVSFSAFYQPILTQVAQGYYTGMMQQYTQLQTVERLYALYASNPSDPYVTAALASMDISASDLIAAHATASADPIKALFDVTDNGCVPVVIDSISMGSESKDINTPQKYLDTALPRILNAQPNAQPNVATDPTDTRTLKEVMGATILETSMTIRVGTFMGNTLQGVLGSLTDAFNLDTDALAGAFNFNLSEDELTRIMEAFTNYGSSSSSQSNLQKLGYADKAKPAMISIYMKDFDCKERVKAFLDDYNDKMEAADDEEKVINYTDITGVLMSSVSTIINAITYVLIAFVSISLIVSSIMIGVITLISVQERTKEIGILRAIGASKRNVSNMFNAETVIIGFASGLIGVLVTYLLCIPINIILHNVTGISTLSANLPVMVAVALVCISMFLTLIAGIIPSRSAAKKDPVVALRTE